MAPLPHVVVFPFPAQGHINPALQFAQLLASSLSLCRVTFINTSHNIAKLRTAYLHLGPHIRLQALADDGQHGHGHDFFERVEYMSGLLETLLLELLQTQAPKEECLNERKEDCGYGAPADASKRADHRDHQQRAPTHSPGYGDLAKACADRHDFAEECSRNIGGSLEECGIDDDWPPPICIISDMFLGWVQDIADKHNLPRFILYTPSPAALVLMLSLPEMLRQGRLPCDDALDEAQKEPLNLPGLTHTLRLADVPSHLLLPPSAFMFNYFIRHSKRIPDAAAILVNTFGELQGSAIDAAQALLDDAYPSMWDNLLLKHQIPRVIPVGPLLPSCMFDESRSLRVSAISRARGAEDDLCLQWLQRQAPSSVVYVSFGSMAELPEEQIKQLAWGLEASGKPFLWVLKGESRHCLPVDFNVGMNLAAGMSLFDASQAGSAQQVLDVTHITPQMDGIHTPRTDMGATDAGNVIPGSSLHTREHKGLVVSWAPQLDVLSHPSVAAFLSHCGWNSTSEAISAGVPVLGWPLFAEQKMNCRFLVDELKVAMEFGKGEGGLVGKEEVARVIMDVLETEQGLGMRQRALEWKLLARNAVTNGGSSQQNLKAFGSFLSSLHTI